MDAEFRNLLEAYNDKVLYAAALAQYLVERGLEKDFIEWCNKLNEKAPNSIKH